ncbi:tetratricopeptide repeat protein [Amycolatopsis sp. NPDC005232]|uniref:tetratricopeptide repeat protein n=1 Tax=Amycolatopsis sp. NPDC005232 TaxID=3157027 RepID=UPI0033B9345E
MADEVARLRAVLAKARDPESLAALERRFDLGCLLMKTGDWPAAEVLFAELAPAEARVVGARHPNTLAAWTNLALSQVEQGRPDEAIPVLAQTAEAYERTWGAKQPGTFHARLLVAQALVVAARYAEALDVLDTHLRTCAAELGPAHAVTLTIGYGKVSVLRALDRFDEAERLLAELASHATTDRRRDTAAAIGLVIRAGRGDPRAAIAPLRELLARHGTDAFREALATALRRAGEAEEAAALLGSILAGRPEHSRESLLIRSSLARAYLETGNLDAAEHEAGAALTAGAWPLGHPALLAAHATLARVAACRGHREEALRGLETVVAGLTAVLGPAHSRTLEAAAWLSEV